MLAKIPDTILCSRHDSSLPPSSSWLEENAALLIKHLIFNNTLKFMILFGPGFSSQAKQEQIFSPATGLNSVSSPPF